MARGDGELVAVGKLLMDLSRWGQSRDAEGRHRAARTGLGTWVGARVASPRCPILRPGFLNVAQETGTGQTPSPWSWLAAGRRPAPVSRGVWPRSPRRARPTCRRE